MKTLPAALATSILNEAISMCRLIKITRTDGVVIGLTDATSHVYIGNQVYRSDVAFSVSSLFVGLNAGQSQGCSLAVALTSDVISRTDIRSRRYYGAIAEFFECDFNNPANTQVSIFKGSIGRCSFSDVQNATIEVLPFSSNQIGFAQEVYSQTCRANLGDARCGIPIESFAVTTTVTTVISPLAFKVATFGPVSAGSPTLDFFAFGQLKWLSGANNQSPGDIMNSSTFDFSVVLFYPMPGAIAVGDQIKLYPGCDLSASTCTNKWNNILNFRGEPLAPAWQLT